MASGSRCRGSSADSTRGSLREDGAVVREDTGLAPVQTGLMVGLSNHMESLLRILCGAWVDRVGGKKLFLRLLGLTLLGMARLVLVLSTSHPDNMDGIFPMLTRLEVLFG